MNTFPSPIRYTVCGYVLSCALLLMLASVGQAKENVIQCANLIYAGNQTSRCFSDQFLTSVQKDTGIATERRFKSVKLNSDELFKYPFVMMTGEAGFRLRPDERKNLKKYLKNGGFLLASAGCSSKKWDSSFRHEMKSIFKKATLEKLKMTHPVFKVVNKIKTLKLHHAGEKAQLEAIELDGKAVVIYSPHGLNDTSHTEGCCCCGGNEIENSLAVNVNIVVYSLLH
jgi:hypothetical protein